jgi:iron transport multicopper oxidase
MYMSICFYDPAGGPFGSHNMPQLFTNSTGMTVEQCISSAMARLTAVPTTTYLYVGLEYGRECYAHIAAPTPEPTQLVGPKACTMTCKGNPGELRGRSNMYNLYARGTAITGTATGTAIRSSTPAVSTKS